MMVQRDQNLKGSKGVRALPDSLKTLSVSGQCSFNTATLLHHVLAMLALSAIVHH